MSRNRHGVSVLGPDDRADFLALTALDPVVNVFPEFRARSTDLEPRLLGGEVWGRFDEGRLVAGCHVGANLVPVQCTPDDARAFGERALTRPRSVITLVGLQPAVTSIWDVVAQSWHTPREIRLNQPHLQIGSDPLVAPDPAVRPATADDLDALYPACVAMYTEEVGVDPETGGGGPIYRARIRQLIGSGWSFVRIEDGVVVFKAEVASLTPAAAQVQGVWVHPEWRGKGLAAAGMAAVIVAVRERLAPVVSLYVNEWNAPANAAYRRVGFTQSAVFATIMF
ncbi:MAG: GNAT family N-acetyltransferase [Nocardioides sp.]